MAHLLTIISTCCVIFMVCSGMFGGAEAIQNHLLMLREQRRSPMNAENLNDPAQLWFMQKVDHYNHQDTRLWKQRYFVNTSSWNKPSGPVFIQIGGEGPISSFYVSGFAMSTYAELHGALQFALEHRFYGLSNPLPTLSTANLQLLSSQQALSDLAYFLEQVIPQYFPPDAKPLVVVFGCSYPGNLAAWFRLKFPNVAVGGVSNSSPVHAVLDFFQYLDVVDNSLSYFMGPTCDQRIQDATDQLQTLLQTPSGQLQVQQMFHTCTVPNTQKDIETFMSNVIGNWQGTVQYNAEHDNPVTITALCDVMENTTMTPLQAYAAVSNSFLEGKCMVISYNVTIAQLRDIIPPNAGRSWFYQTCTEFGYYQTTDSPPEVQPFGDLLPLAYYTQMCTDAFGFPFNDPTPATNLYYGSDHPVGSNVLFVSGSVDPWHALTVTQNLTDSVRAFLISGSAHCAQVFPASDEVNAPPGIFEAQQYTNQNIARWLAQGNPTC